MLLMNPCINTPCCSPYMGDYEEETSFFQNLNIPFPIIAGNPCGWRMRSKLAVRGTIDAPSIGLFKERSHDVYEIPKCAAHHPQINLAISCIKHWIKRCKIPPYREAGHSGLLRYLQLVVQRKTGRVQASLVISSEESARFKTHLQKLLEDNIWHSLWINKNPSHSNTIFSPNWELFYGPEWLEEEIGGVPCSFLPGSFGQANLTMFERLIASIDTSLPPGGVLGEFYAGIGIIGISLAKKFSRVILSEINPESKRCFDHMRASLDSTHLDYRLGSSLEALDILNEIDTAIVDPPRKGLDFPILKALNESKRVKTAVYVSCGFSSFVRDANQLLEWGWKITKAEGYLFFPGTPHLETLCLFSRG
jgi:23S rRNA (uracil1939-C5)-methyltransferase